MNEKWNMKKPVDYAVPRGTKKTVVVQTRVALPMHTLKKKKVSDVTLNYVMVGGEING